MGKKSNIIHQAKKNLQKQCKYGQSKHKAKEQAREEAKRTGEKFNKFMVFIALTPMTFIVAFANLSSSTH